MNPFLYIGISIFIAFFGIYFYYSNKVKYKVTANTKSLLEEHVTFYKNLDYDEKQRFIKRIVSFLNDVNITGIDVELEEIDYLLVACSAVIPVFGFKDFYYNNLNTVLIYPSTFNQDLAFGKDAKDKRIGGMVGTGRYEGQMILSQKSLHAGFNNHNQKQNTGIHEFVHLIDKMDGDTDGIPEVLMEQHQEKKWYSLLNRKMQRIRKNHSDIRKYGAQSKAEFFAVVSEYFFNKPKAFKKKHPKLNKLLSKFYKTRK